MPVVNTKKEKQSNNANVTVIKRMRDYTKEPVFKKKAAKVIAFVKKNGLPKTFKRKAK